jgi:imidazolonepropionase-like amidohydrolase
MMSTLDIDGLNANFWEAFLTPTLITYQAMAAKEFGNFLPPSIASKNLQVLDAGLKSIQIADAAGVTMCYGTDLLGPLQVKQTGEFTLRKKAGLSNLKILQAATVNAARMLRQEETLGRLKEGFSADLIVLNANPLEDIEVLDRPERHLLAVVKEGRVLESRWSKMPSELDETLVIE